MEPPTGLEKLPHYVISHGCIPPWAPIRQYVLCILLLFYVTIFQPKSLC